MAQSPVKPPQISTKNSNKSLGPGSPRQRSLTFGSTSDKATSSRNLPDDNTTGPDANMVNLAKYLDWRNAKFSKDDINPDLWKIALCIWDFLPASDPFFYRLKFGDATKHGITNMKPPMRVTTSVSGDLVYCFYSTKQYIDYTDTSTIIVLVPYIDSLNMVGVSHWETLTNNDRCTWWEIEHSTITHIGFDRDDHIYFTNGESVYRIMTVGEKIYRKTHDEIWSVDGDTSHITSLWRQGDQLYFTTQDWEKEDHLDLYKIKYGKSAGRLSSAASPTSPSGARGRAQTGRPASAKNSHNRNNSGGSVGRTGSASGNTTPRSPSNDGESSVSKVRTFSLEFHQRVWQLTWLRYEKKFLLGIAACRGGTQPQLMQISFKKKLKLMPLGSKHYTWPRPYDDAIPHDFIYHRPTRTWLLYLAVYSTKDGQDPQKAKNRYWVQFRLDAGKKKVVWHRLIPLNESLCNGEWLHYDEIRDVLIGWDSSDDKENEYKLKFLPDVSKLLWVEMSDENKENDDEKAASPELDITSKSADTGSATSPKKSNKKGGKNSKKDNLDTRPTTKSGKNSKGDSKARPRSAAARGHAKSAAVPDKDKDKAKGKGKSSKNKSKKPTKSSDQNKDSVLDVTMD